MLPSTAVAMAMMTWAVGDGLPDGVRSVGIPSRDYWYKSFDTRVVGSRKELDGLFEETGRSDNWKPRPSDFEEFRRAVADAKVDFDTEVLWLVRHTEGSGSVRVRFRLTEQPGEVLRATVDRTVPAACTWDMAYYCFAVVVPRDRAKKVEVGRPADLLDRLRRR